MKLYKIPIKTIVQPTIFFPRGQKTSMSYRYYPSWSTHTMVLLHGLVSNSIYLSFLASQIAEKKIAQVIVPDLRSHGDDSRELSWGPESSGILQDFEEILIHFKSRTAVQRMSIAGHSFGAQWLTKILSMAPSSIKFDHAFLFAPYLHRSQAKFGWLEFQSDQYSVQWPEGPRTGKEHFTYPKSFFDAFNMSDSELNSIFAKTPFHLLESSSDEILKPLDTSIAISDRQMFPTTHMGIVMEPSATDQICSSMEKLIGV
jgi:pimeloyl-ACP methyl ester carboxylesterase